MTMTQQEIFTAVATHLLTQNKKSLAMDGDHQICAYRGEGGTSCAVGCLIKDSHYNIDMEGNGVQSFNLVVALIGSGVLEAGLPTSALSDPRVRLLAELQGIHDGCPVAEWRDTLYDLAHAKGLTMPETLP